MSGTALPAVAVVDARRGIEDGGSEGGDVLVVGHEVVCHAWTVRDGLTRGAADRVCPLLAEQDIVPEMIDIDTLARTMVDAFGLDEAVARARASRQPFLVATIERQAIEKHNLARRRRNPTLEPDALAEQLAAYLNTDVDPYDFGHSYLFGQWLDAEMSEEMSEEEARLSESLTIDDFEYDDTAKERFTEWLKRAPKGEVSPLRQEMRDEPLGVPSYLYFSDAYPLGKDAWCVHFTKRAFSAFDRGATLEMLGLSTHFKTKAVARCEANLDDGIDFSDRVFGFAFPVAELKRPQAVRDARRKYGNEAILFQTDAAVSAYHETDDERQAIFPLCSERNVHEVSFQAGSSDVWLGGSERENDGGEDAFASLEEATRFLESTKPSALRTPPRAGA